jgi:hypothetical protein
LPYERELHLCMAKWCFTRVIAPTTIQTVRFCGCVFC